MGQGGEEVNQGCSLKQILPGVALDQFPRGTLRHVDHSWIVLIRDNCHWLRAASRET